MQAQDMRGRPIKAGDEVAYPDRRGSRLWLNTATVEDVVTVKSWRGEERPALRVRRHHSRTGDYMDRASMITVLGRVLVISRG